MDISALVHIFNVAESAVAAKANEFVRQSRIRIRSLGEADICRNVICLHLAWIACNKQDFPEALALKYSGTSEKVYRKSFQFLRNALGVETVRLEQLVIQFGCMSLVGYANSILTAFKSKSSMSGQPTAAMMAAILLMCAKRQGVTLDTKGLLKKCQITSKELNQACCLVQHFCDNDLNAIPNSTKKSKSGRKKVTAPSHDLLDDAGDNAVNAANIVIDALLRSSKDQTPTCSRDENERGNGAVDPSLSYLWNGGFS